MEKADEKHWKKISALRDPFNDAVNYRSRQEKEFFNQIFLRTDDLFQSLRSSVFFLIGEKGSGKTAYASYLENNEIEENRCKLSTMTESQYKRFMQMKRSGKLDYSDYANIWRPMLLAMMAQAIIIKSKGFIQGITGKFDAIENQVKSFNRETLNPEVEVAFELVTQATDKFMAGNEKAAKVESSDQLTSSDKSTIIKHHLLEKETNLKEAISDLKLKKNHILFIDGIDYRPEDVPYVDYLACIKGLGEASWQLNSEFFSNIRDSPGRIKIVLLVRPDVFHSLNLYNSNSKLRDNSVLLDWSTTESELRQSKLYEAADLYFSKQQSFKSSALSAADHYLSASTSNEIFKQFLRRSFQKPRDLLTLIRLIKEVSTKRLQRGNEDRFSSDVMRNPAFTREYADYMLGEVKNYAAFYMPASDFVKYMKFFQYMDGKAEFKFADFSAAFERFRGWINGEELSATEYIRDPEALLQLFYDVNIIGYREEVGQEGERHYHFAYRERTLTNVAPQIKLTASLMINPGLAKALDIGLRARAGATTTKDGDRRRRNHRRKMHSRQKKSQKLSDPAIKATTPSDMPASNPLQPNINRNGKSPPKRPNSPKK
ncbi:P-loop ATPase, Sll1717 family [Xanthomonas sacchari]